jgi:hypothetical protein
MNRVHSRAGYDCEAESWFTTLKDHHSTTDRSCNVHARTQSKGLTDDGNNPRRLFTLGTDAEQMD